MKSIFLFCMLFVGLTFTIVAQPCIDDTVEITLTVANVDCNTNPTGNIFTAVTGGTAPYTYLWTDGSTDAAVYSPPYGAYCVTATDVNGCSAAVCDTVALLPTLLVVSLCPLVPHCHGDCYNAIEIVIAAGTAPFTFLWNDGATTEDRDSLCAGLYILTVTDANGCTFEQAHPPFLDPDTMIVNVSVANAACYDSCNGSAVVDVVGGVEPYEIMFGNIWDSVVTDLCAGIYPVMVIDDVGCVFSDTFAVTEPLAFVFAVTGSDSASVYDTLAYNVVNIPGVFYDWFISDSNAAVNGQGTNQITVQWNDTGLQNIVVLITDSAGCTSWSDTFIVQSYQPSSVGIRAKAIRGLVATAYPNPARDVVVLSMTAGLRSNVELRIHGVDNREVYAATIGVASGKNQVTLDTQHLTNGLYTVELGDGRDVTRLQFVVSR